MHLREGEFEKAHTDFFEVKIIDDLTDVFLGSVDSIEIRVLLAGF